MAKKKTPGSTARKPAGTVSPLTGGEATTSEEVQLAVANDDGRTSRQPSYEEIAEAAYRRYLSRGGIHGQDFDDWVEAERELQQHRSR